MAEYGSGSYQTEPESWLLAYRVEIAICNARSLHIANVGRRHTLVEQIAVI